MMEGTAVLISRSYIKDDIGQDVSTESRTEIWVTQKSITRNEWYEAGRNGLNPQIVLETSLVDYSGENLVEYNGERYGVYRTYSPPDRDTIELYLEKKAGV